MSDTVCSPAEEPDNAERLSGVASASNAPHLNPYWRMMPVSRERYVELMAVANGVVNDAEVGGVKGMEFTVLAGMIVELASHRKEKAF